MISTIYLIASIYGLLLNKYHYDSYKDKTYFNVAMEDRGFNVTNRKNHYQVLYYLHLINLIPCIAVLILKLIGYLSWY